MKWVVGYDVSSSSNRQHVSRRLERFGFRRQLSVFEGEASPAELTTLFAELLTLIDPQSDVVTAWPAAEAPHTPIVHIGRARPPTRYDWLLI